LSELKRKGWCFNLSTNAQNIARGFQFFTITLYDLSEEGLANIEGILTLVFQYLNMLKQEKPLKWIFDEMNDLRKFIY
jgi:insulysin